MTRSRGRYGAASGDKGACACGASGVSPAQEQRIGLALGALLRQPKTLRSRLYHPTQARNRLKYTLIVSPSLTQPERSHLHQSLLQTWSLISLIGLLIKGHCNLAMAVRLIPILNPMTGTTRCQKGWRRSHILDTHD